MVSIPRQLLGRRSALESDATVTGRELLTMSSSSSEELSS